VVRHNHGKQAINEILDSGARGSAFLGKHGYDPFTINYLADVKQQRLNQLSNKGGKASFQQDSTSSVKKTYKQGKLDSIN